MKEAIRVEVVSVFGSPEAAGNPTAVVLGRPLSTQAALELAARLGFPDTVFAWKDDAGWHARFFSPREELSVCYHALLAAAHVIGESQCSFRLVDRSLSVERSEDDAWWVLTPRSSLVERGNVETPFGPARIIDSGRARAYVLLDRAEPDQVATNSDQPDSRSPGTDRFRTVTWPAAEAFSWLEANRVSGLVLVATDQPDSIGAGPDQAGVRIRVFTTSLGGSEDVATGGAAAGLPLFLDTDRALEIEQGVGPFARRGALRVQQNDRTIRVGGATKPLIRGLLSADLGVAHT